MSATLKRRLQRLEQAAGKVKRNRATNTLVEPSANATDEQWRLFEIRKVDAEASAETIIVIRAGQPVRPIAYRCRHVIVPPKIPAQVEVRTLPMEGAQHAH